MQGAMRSRLARKRTGALKMKVKDRRGGEEILRRQLLEVKGKEAAVRRVAESKVDVETCRKIKEMRTESKTEAEKKDAALAQKKTDEVQQLLRQTMQAYRGTKQPRGDRQGRREVRKEEEKP